ncbi:MAG TPA: hypothetical protein VMD59_14005, partial [Acidimicrobiales bacterium]|nr:hypothetical protein [Acidimicrobiales bacterium]
MSGEEHSRRMVSDGATPPIAGAGEGLVVEGVSKRFHTAAGTTVALANVSLNVERGRFVTLIGPSG